MIDRAFYCLKYFNLFEKLQIDYIVLFEAEALRAVVTELELRCTEIG